MARGNHHAAQTPQPISDLLALGQDFEQLANLPPLDEGMPQGKLRLDLVAVPPAWSSSQVRVALRRTALRAGVRRRFAPHQLRHAHAVEMAREGVPLNVIQRQLGHANLGVTSIYLQGIDSGEIIETVRARRPPVIPAAAALAE